MGNSVSKYLFMNQVLKHLAHRRTLNKTVAIVMWVITGIFALALLVAWIMAWGLVARNRGAGILGGIIYQLIFVAMAYMLVHTYMIRAREVWSLPDGDYRAIPLISIFLKLAGETYAIFLASMGIGTGISLWFRSGVSPFFDLPFGLSRYFSTFESSRYLYSEGGFVAGILYMVGGVLLAIVSIMFFYFLSEMIYVLVEIAKNTGYLKQGIAVQNVVASESLKCPKCGTGVKKDDKFCENCGSALTQDQA